MMLGRGKIDVRPRLRYFDSRSGVVDLGQGTWSKAMLMRLKPWSFEADVRPLGSEVKPIEADVRPLGAEVKPFEDDVRPLKVEVKPFEADVRPLGAEVKPFEVDVGPPGPRLREWKAKDNDNFDDG
ncbi:hypothetical protein Tco_0056645 [Tanacetum coccineum]